MLKKFHTHLSRGEDWYSIYKKEIKLATNIPIINKLLYQELANACEKHEGILTYAEYLMIDQFGKHGYYATGKFHGKTDVEKRWAGALAQYCKNNKYETLIEFGCGTGELGVSVAKAYKKQANRVLKWIGVEIDTKMHTKIRENFKLHKLEDTILGITTTIDELPDMHNPLIVFPYSLDNIPPHVFFNTQENNSHPNSLLGVQIKNGMLTEVIIPAEILKKKGIQLENGFFTQNNYTFDLSLWKLRKGQRAYIATDAFKTLYHYAKTFGGKSPIIIIDEFRKEPIVNAENLGTPKSLYEKNLITYDRSRYYRESGAHNLYYPLYKGSLLKFLHTIGFKSIEYEIEQKKAAQLQNKPWLPIGKNYTTLAFFANNFTARDSKKLLIPFPMQKLY